MSSLYVPVVRTKLLCGHYDCMYAGNFGSKYSKYCDYLRIENHSRPCKPTPDCICYKKGVYPINVEQLHLQRYEG